MKGSIMKTHVRFLSVFFVLAFTLVLSAATTQPVYKSPQSAVNAFVAALRKNDLTKLVKIFGEGSEKLFVSEDKVAGANTRKAFLDLYDAKHKVISREDGSGVLIVGKDQWPFPVPLEKTERGWMFDSPAGFEEIVNRRIGRNELDAIQTVLAIADAERDYYHQDRNGDGVLEYAQKFRSTEGQHDGLYWKVNKNEALSPLGAFVADAADEGYTEASTSYHGYHYRLISSQGPHAQGGEYDYMVRSNQIGGFAIVAYPAAYGETGVMTFIMNHSGLMFQRDLGATTKELALAINTFDPDSNWQKISERDMQPLPPDPDTGE